MTATTSQPPETLLYSYRIASGDMKYIEINTREIYLRRDEARGYVLRGEIPECGASCYANLSRVFLEYAMSCRGLEDSSEVLETVIQFGEQLAEQLVSCFTTTNQAAGSQDPVPAIFDCVMASMNDECHKEITANGLVFTFPEPPLATTATRYGHQRWISPAYQGLVIFFERILESAGSGWALRSSKAKDRDHSLQVISLQLKN